ncbi:MAG: alpha/beta hydrolase, partial [Proteobacteria bacterium]|nr:alpha/beta hydrolase [Pseudomonadota bacterium]
MKFIILFSLLVSSPLFAEDYDFAVEVHGQGTPMLLIPGLSNAGAVWDETVARYKSDYQMHVVTLPGFAGHPAMAKTDPYLTQVRDQLLAYLKDQNLNNPVVVGHSLGGYMALMMAVEQPDLFKKIVIVDSVPFIPALTMPGATEDNSKAMADMMKSQMNQQDENLRSASLDQILSTMITDPERIKLAKKWGMDSDPASVNQAMYDMMTSDLRQEIATIKTPTLVMGSWIAYKDYGMNHERLKASYGAQYAAMENHELVITDTG